VVSATVIWQTLRKAGASISLKRSKLRNGFLPSSLEMRMSLNGHLAGVSVFAFPSDCLCVGTNRMCPDGICIKVSILGWLRITADR
jgi:hypothetical protein